MDWWNEPEPEDFRHVALGLLVLIIIVGTVLMFVAGVMLAGDVLGLWEFTDAL